MRRFLGLILLLALAASPAAAEETFAGYDFTSAVECGRCHQDLYKSWRATYHALAAQNPVFLNEMEKLDSGLGRGLRVQCLACHSPTTALTMDYSLARPLSREGVTCDFCHTVVETAPNAPALGYVNDLSPVKRGPGRADALPAHRVKPNALLLQAAFCAGCHQWLNPRGVAVLDTYREWEASVYRGENINCQFCHMPEILNATVMMAGRPEQRPSRFHSEMGGHSQAQLKSAAVLRLDASLKQRRIDAAVEVENFRGGHFLPTGIPSRGMVLRLVLLDGSGRVLDSREKTYGRLLVDEQGAPLDDFTSWYQKAARVAEDNRIAPKERRRETFAFTVPENSGAMMVEAKLSYRLQAAAPARPAQEYEMASASRIVGGPTGFSPRNLIYPAAAVIILFLLALVLLTMRVRHPDVDENK